MGLSAGLVLGLMLSQAMRSALYGVTPTDVGNLAFVLATLGVVAIVASVIPAVRAARVDVIQALRAD
jgi:ABC-type antimicrobial peptide transport system permease subunit